MSTAKDLGVLLTTSRFRVVRRTYRDAQDREHRREVVEHPGAVVLLPLLDDGRVCLIRNYRVAVGDTLWELPAGTLEPPEDPAVTAACELIEETGYRAARIEPLAQFWMSPGILNERMHCYVATGLVAGEQQLEAGEQIQVHPLSWAEIERLIDTGAIQDAKTLTALLLWQRRAKK